MTEEQIAEYRAEQARLAALYEEAARPKVIKGASLLDRIGDLTGGKGLGRNMSERTREACKEDLAKRGELR